MHRKFGLTRFTNMSMLEKGRIVINLCNQNKNLTFAYKQTAMEKNPYIELAECLLPEEMVEYFEVVKVEKTGQAEIPVHRFWEKC